VFQGFRCLLVTVNWLAVSSSVLLGPASDFVMALT